MANTPGFIVPATYPSQEAAEEDLRRRGQAAGYTTFDPSQFFSDETIAHFGTKGMKWGQRKKRADEGQRKKTFGPAELNARNERARKIRRGALVVGGAVALALVLSKSGRTKITDLTVTNYAHQRAAKAQAAANPFADLAKRFRDVKAASIPSPREMMNDAEMAGIRNQGTRRINEILTDKTWRDQSKMATMARDMRTSKFGVLNPAYKDMTDEAIRRARSG